MLFHWTLGEWAVILFFSVFLYSFHLKFLQSLTKTKENIINNCFQINFIRIENLRCHSFSIVLARKIIYRFEFCLRFNWIIWNTIWTGRHFSIEWNWFSFKTGKKHNLRAKNQIASKNHLLDVMKFSEWFANANISTMIHINPRTFTLQTIFAWKDAYLTNATKKCVQ